MLEFRGTLTIAAAFMALSVGFLIIADIPKTPPEQFRQYDRNGDNKISLGEGVGGKVVEFFDADVNNDGVMSLAELLDIEHMKAAS